MKDMANITIAIKYEVTYWFEIGTLTFLNWHINIWPWHILKLKIKVMQIFRVNILEMVMDWTILL